MLRKSGDFSNVATVEYATIIVKAQNSLIPKNLRSFHYEHNDDSMISLSVSPSGRLRTKEIVLESVELANEFVEYLHQLFSVRKYKNKYELQVKVETTTCTKRTTKSKGLDSDSVRNNLGCFKENTK